MSESDPEFSIALRNEALKWRILVDEGELDHQEKEAFQEWLGADPLHEQAFDQATTMWDAFGTLDREKVCPEHLTDTIMDRLRALITRLKAPAFSVRATGFALTGVAASVLLAILVLPQIGRQTVMPKPEVTAYATELGRIQTIALSDGSAVTLGPASKLEVAMATDKRDVTLISGAAVFDVTSDPNRPFIVRAEAFEARVVGTVFDVRSNGGGVRLSVAEGTVEARHPFVIDDTSTSLISTRMITAGQRVEARPKSGLSKVQTFEADRFALWRENRLRYNEAPLTELVADANRYSSVPITIEAGATDIGQLTVTFGYDGNDIDAMLGALPAMFPVVVDRDVDKTIIIRPLD
ncbi:MAG: FecR domain-containing protein [Sphingomonadales bacterium]